MKPGQQRNLEIFALPAEEQRDALMPIYREIYDSYNVDWAKNTELFHDDYVFEGRGSISFPGMPQRVVGIEAYIEGHSEMAQIVDVESVDIDDLIPLGEGRVVVLSRVVVRAGGGRIDQQVLELHEFLDGLLHRQYYWFHRDEGRRELGL